jgi:protein NrfC
VDGEHGHIRRIDAEACEGCWSCIRACPYSPSRISWNPDTQKAAMCDLCLDTPFWGEQGGVGGKQACAEVCPFGAITFTQKTPVQSGDIGYKVELTVE